MQCSGKAHVLHIGDCRTKELVVCVESSNGPRVNVKQRAAKSLRTSGGANKMQNSRGEGRGGFLASHAKTRVEFNAARGEPNPLVSLWKARVKPFVC